MRPVRRVRAAFARRDKPLGADLSRHVIVPDHAAVLGMQGEGSSYLYFGHVGQLLLGEELARQGVEPALDYILRDVETRLDTALYLVRGGTAGKAITAAGEDGSAADRLEALAEDAGLLAGSMPRTVKDAQIGRAHV